MDTCFNNKRLSLKQRGNAVLAGEEPGNLLVCLLFMLNSKCV